MPTIGLKSQSYDKALSALEKHFSIILNKYQSKAIDIKTISCRNKVFFSNIIFSQGGSNVVWFKLNMSSPSAYI